MPEILREAKRETRSLGIVVYVPKHATFYSEIAKASTLALLYVCTVEKDTVCGSALLLLSEIVIMSRQLAAQNTHKNECGLLEKTLQHYWS